MPSATCPTASVSASFSVLSLFWAAAWSGISRYRIRVKDIGEREFVAVGRPGCSSASWMIYPTAESVLMSSVDDGWTCTVGFPSLRAALLAIYLLSEGDLRQADRQAVSDSAIVPELH